MAHFGAALAQDLINAGSPTDLHWKQKHEHHCQHNSLYLALVLESISTLRIHHLCHSVVLSC